jgi:hypothetical protein
MSATRLLPATGGVEPQTEAKPLAARGGDADELAALTANRQPSTEPSAGTREAPTVANVHAVPPVQYVQNR